MDCDFFKEMEEFFHLEEKKKFSKISQQDLESSIDPILEESIQIFKEFEYELCTNLGERVERYRDLNLTMNSTMDRKLFFGDETTIGANSHVKQMLIMDADLGYDLLRSKTKSGQNFPEFDNKKCTKFLELNRQGYLKRSAFKLGRMAARLQNTFAENGNPSEK